MTTEIIRSIVRRQLAAMGYGPFDIGVLQASGRMLLRENWKPDRIEAALKWLRRENARGAHIFVRLHGEHRLSLIDDLSSAAILTMVRDGFEPALIVETSAGNFQCWLNHGQTLDRELSKHAATELARRFGGDLSSADWRHFGRLAGFTNQKKERRLKSGLAPYVKLHESSGRIYRMSTEFLRDVNAQVVALAANRNRREAARSQIAKACVRSVADFHRDVRYRGDLHRSDMAWAVYAASCGMTAAEIERAILNARDLSKKGTRKRQIAYAERTAIKALAGVRSTHP